MILNDGVDHSYLKMVNLLVGFGIKEIVVIVGMNIQILGNVVMRISRMNGISVLCVGGNKMLLSELQNEVCPYCMGEFREILVAHGGIHHDTIVTVEYKKQDSLERFL